MHQSIRPLTHARSKATAVLQTIALVVIGALAASACSTTGSQAVGTLGELGAEQTNGLVATSPTPASQPESVPTASALPIDRRSLDAYFETVPAGGRLPTEAACAQAVRSAPSPETHSQNIAANAKAGGPSVRIDGADEFWNGVLAPRITGNFTGSTDDLIRWVACKWGFDEDLTRARAWTESSWDVGTRGDRTSDAQQCSLIGLDSPCFQSYGLLQVKGTVHEGTFPFAHESSAWGLDYAMAWQRACFEGSFEWLIDSGYTANDVRGCVGAWFSGEWYDSLAAGYLGDVDQNLARRPWD